MPRSSSSESPDDSGSDVFRVLDPPGVVLVVLPEVEGVEATFVLLGTTSVLSGLLLRWSEPLSTCSTFCWVFILSSLAG